MREFKKTIGGLDCVGEKVGEAIVSKVRSEFAGAIGSQRADELVDNVPVDIADCGTPWWTSQVRVLAAQCHAFHFISCFLFSLQYESPKEQQHRLKEFLEFVHHNGHDTAIYVGHSHFYKDLCASIIGSKLPIIKPDIAIKLSKYKLSNASMLGLTIVFPHDSDVPFIEDASLLFGGDFVSGDDAGGPTVDIENRL